MHTWCFMGISKFCNSKWSLRYFNHPEMRRYSQDMPRSYYNTPGRGRGRKWRSCRKPGGVWSCHRAMVMPPVCAGGWNLCLSQQNPQPLLEVPWRCWVPVHGHTSHWRWLKNVEKVAIWVKDLKIDQHIGRNPKNQFIGGRNQESKYGDLLWMVAISPVHRW